VGGRDAEIIAGDLRETYIAENRGPLWYWGQVASCLLVRLSPHRRMIPEIARDLHYALRTIRMNPGYAATAMLCLGLGIGVNTIVFSWLDEMYFRKLAVPDADRVVSISRGGAPACSWRDYVELRRDVKSLESVAAIIPKGTFLDVDRVNSELYVEVVSANYFDTMRIQPRAGRGFTPVEDLATSEPVAVISDAAWQRHFQRDPRAVGTRIRIEAQWYRIVGIAPSSYRGASAPLAIDAWVPLATYPHYRGQLAEGRSSGPNVYLIARLAQSISVAEANAEMQVVDSRLRPKFKNRMVVQPVTGYRWVESQRAMKPIAMLLGTVVCVVLLIACVNVANLLLSRATVRQREMAVRRALGASRGQLVRQGITEGLVLAMGGAALGLLLGFWANRILATLLPSAHPAMVLHTIYLDVNWRVAAFTALMSMLCALLFSLSPAMENARGDVTPLLKGGSGPGVRERWRRRDRFVVAQVALSLMLLICSALLLRALRQAESTELGFATDKRLYVRLFTPESDFTPQQANAIYGRLLDEARGIAGVRDVTLSFAVFGFMDGDCASSSRGESPRKLNINVVASNYFDFMGVPILRGRSFLPSDREGSPRVVVINETMARRWWPGEEALGKTAWLGCEEGKRVPAEVVGIVRDSKYGSIDEEPRPFYFVHWRQVWWNGYFALMVHASGDPQAVEAPLLRLAQSGGENVRVSELRTFDDLVALSLFVVKWQARLLGAFSLLAIVLATVGLYGVVAYMVAQRTAEIGIRVALGAQSADVQWMVLGHALRLTCIGIGIGLVFAAFATSLLRKFLYGVNPLDPMAFSTAALAWVLISMLASYLPARRATRVDPLVALRYE
jgi:predicted permease